MSLTPIDKRSPKELHILNEVAKAITVPLDLPDMLESVMDRIDEVIAPAEFGIIWLWEESEGAFRLRASCGQGVFNSKALYTINLGPEESISGAVFKSGTAQVYTTPAEVEKGQTSMTPENRKLMQQAFGPDFELRSIMAAPLQTRENKYGVILLGTLQGPYDFKAEDLPFLQTLADLIALAIDRARLEQETNIIMESKQAERMRAEALAVLSHELRTPLAAIKGYATALMLEEVDWPVEKTQEFLRLIDEETDNLQIMINDILDSSLIDIGQISLEYQPVQLNRIAKEIATDMQRRTEQHRFIVDFPDHFPVIDADSRRIKQIIRNIIDNSIKYSPDGGMIVIRGEVRKNDVVISIADQGVGISPEDLIPLFDKYFRVKAPTGFYVPGTGLGLPVARELVEEHGGRIWAESKVGEGTTLYFSLPLKSKEAL